MVDLGFTTETRRALRSIESLNLPETPTKRLLDQLEDAKRNFSPGQHQKIVQLLTRLKQHKFKDAETLVRYHEILLFLRAYPQSSRIVQTVDDELSNFAGRVESLAKAGAKLDALDEAEVSGIVGRPVTDTLNYYIVRWLAQRYPTQISIDWDWFENENRLAETWPRFMPLFEEDALVEANVPYQQWLDTARGRVRALAWLVNRFDSLPLAVKEKAELYDSLQLYVSWTPSFRLSRTGMRLPPRQIFFHRRPLIQRRDVSLQAQIEASPPEIIRLPVRQGAAILELARATSTLRYRELYGFTHGDPARVLKASLGRGVELYVTSLPASRRLPLRAYHAAMIFKNGIPVGYFEGLSLFERMESGFNLYYTFRDGETAWLYARTLNVFRHLLGVTVFVLDPYQIGYRNEEGIESGAFWFYRKLGFRPTRRELLQMTALEEKKISAKSAYRTPKTVLRKLAAGPMIFELERSQIGEWDRFQMRNIGFAVQRHMAAHFNGDASKFRSDSVRAITRLLGTDLSEWREAQLPALNDFAVALSLVPELGRWSAAEKKMLAEIIRAKAGADESRFLKLMQKHPRLRVAIIKLGSSLR